MYIFLDTNDKGFAEEVYSSVQHSHGNASLTKGIESLGFAPKEGQIQIFYGENPFDHLPLADSRLAQLAFATEGGMLFTDKPRKVADSPLYAGPIPFDNASHVSIVIGWNMLRAKAMKEYNITYFGLTSEDPEVIIVLDNKKSSTTQVIKEYLEFSTPKWWTSLAFVTTKNANYLKDLLEELPYTYVVAGTPFAKAKLEYAGIETIDGSDIPRTTEGLKKLRYLTHRAGR